MLTGTRAWLQSLWCTQGFQLMGLSDQVDFPGFCRVISARSDPATRPCPVRFLLQNSWAKLFRFPLVAFLSWPLLLVQSSSVQGEGQSRGSPSYVSVHLLCSVPCFLCQKALKEANASFLFLMTCVRAGAFEFIYFFFEIFNPGYRRPA